MNKLAPRAGSAVAILSHTPQHDTQEPVNSKHLSEISKNDSSHTGHVRITSTLRIIVEQLDSCDAVWV